MCSFGLRFPLDDDATWSNVIDSVLNLKWTTDRVHEFELSKNFTLAFVVPNSYTPNNIFIKFKMGLLISEIMIE